MKHTAIALLAIFFNAAATASAATHTWKGGAPNNLWSTPANWVGNSAPAAAESGVKLVFPDSAFSSPVDDLAGLNVDAITVSGSTAYTLSGLGSAKLTLTGLAADNFINGVSSGHTTVIAGTLPVVLAGSIVHITNGYGGLHILSVISGPGALVLDGPADGQVHLGGTVANTFSGGIYCQSGTLILAKTAGLNVLGSGGISICYPGTGLPARVEVRASNQIPNTQHVSVGPQGEFVLNAPFQETIDGLTLQGGTVTMTGGVIDPALYLNGDVEVPAISGGFQAAAISGGSVILNGTRTCDVAPGAELNLACNVYDGVSAGGISKTGAGKLTLRGNNSFTGPVSVQTGILSAYFNTSLGATTGSTTIFSGATLELHTNLAEPLSLQSGTIFSGGSQTCSGPLQVSGVSEVTTYTGQTLTLSGVVSGSGVLVTSTGQLGSIVLSGNQPNTFSGLVLVKGGPLVLNKLTPPAINGELDIITAAGQAPAQVLCFKPNQISASADVVLGTPLENLLDLNSQSTTIGSLSGGGTVSLGSATLNTGGNNATTEFHGVITGGAAGGLIKSGTGGFTINPATVAGQPVSSSYTGWTTINDGALVINDQQTGAVLVNAGARLSGSGSVGNVSNTGGGQLCLCHLKTLGLFASGAGNQFFTALNGFAAANYEHVQATGQVQLSGTVLTATLNFQPVVSSTFTVIDNDGNDAVSGTFNGLAEGAALTVSGKPFKISYHGGDGNDVVLTYTGPGPAQPRITGFTASADRSTVQLQAVCTVGYTYLWQRSTDLQTWTNLPTGTPNSHGTLTATFTIAGTPPARLYYRLVLP